jgi:hypothetical protein
VSAEFIAAVYGALPPPARRVRAQRLHGHVAMHNHPTLPMGTSTESLRVQVLLESEGAEEIQFGLQLFVPATKLVRCMIVCGDGCWRTMSDAALRNLLRNDCGIALFNRTEIAPDMPLHSDRAEAATLYRAYPNANFGAISAWAWSYSRVVDAIATLSELANVPIAFTGHSRGGKAVLLAGASDLRAAFVHANNAGILGSAPLQHVGVASETWQALVQTYPQWVSGRLQKLAAEGGTLSLEQDSLLSAISPRKLLITQATDDAWANPLGTAHLVEKIRPGFAGKLRLIERQGGHPMLDADWRALVDFILN